MRQNPSFAMTDVGELRRLIDHNPWVTLVSSTDDGLVASHYAVLLDEGRDDLTIVGHVGRPDDIVHGLGQRELLVVVQGPHGYISPGWYGDTQSVPTWNFVAAHLTGVPELLSTEENLAVLDRLVERFESRMPQPRLMWQPPNDRSFIEKLEKGTVGFRLTPTRVVAKRKLSQNKSPEVVETIIAELSGDGPYADPQLAAEMRRAHDAIAAARASLEAADAGPAR
ncbi:FMN-binding negative transcriptional regulator [Microbacterium sp.]|uniref:FMN-binding negative transcriptional regulator n=1 Tax=Microbacterium sp. TaxID=51671 RepID=UPI002BEE1501|nr:FMN-binding negative transcriptional regulator [Microbacterium sp.]HWL78841.1 FMN-binding negative transcriptional regulator [Microbacterium sp.]